MKKVIFRLIPGVIFILSVFYNFILLYYYFYSNSLNIQHSFEFFLTQATVIIYGNVESNTVVILSVEF